MMLTAVHNLHSYFSGTYMEVTVLLFLDSFTVITLDYLLSYSVEELCGYSIVAV